MKQPERILLLIGGLLQGVVLGLVSLATLVAWVLLSAEDVMVFRYIHF